MYEIQISDRIYEQVREAARMQHISIDAFVEEAVNRRLRSPQRRNVNLFGFGITTQNIAACRRPTLGMLS